MKCSQFFFYSLTQPYWSYSSRPKITAIKMRPFYRNLVKKLTYWINNIDPLIEGMDSLNGESLRNQYPFVFQSILIEKHFCNDLLKDFCTALKSKSEHLFKNFMDKEKYFFPSEETVSAAQSPALATTFR